MVVSWRAWLCYGREFCKSEAPIEPVVSVNVVSDEEGKTRMEQNQGTQNSKPVLMPHYKATVDGESKTIVSLTPVAEAQSLTKGAWFGNDVTMWLTKNLRSSISTPLETSLYTEGVFCDPSADKEAFKEQGLPEERLVDLLVVSKEWYEKELDGSDDTMVKKKNTCGPPGMIPICSPQEMGKPDCNPVVSAMSLLVTTVQVRLLACMCHAKVCTDKNCKFGFVCTSQDVRGDGYSDSQYLCAQFSKWQAPVQSMYMVQNRYAPCYFL